jgi:hypothetical protein
MIERKVLMPDGVVREHHTLAQITHVIGEITYIDVRSYNSNPDNFYDWQFAVPYDSTITETDAYERLSALDEMAEYHDPLDAVLDILTDEQAENVTEVFPAWLPNVAYIVGDRRKYDDRLYKCIQAHNSQEGWEPPNVPSLWVRTAADPEEIPEWVQPTGAHDAYQTGDKVWYEGKVWVCTADNNVYAPGVWGWTEFVGE